MKVGEIVFFYYASRKRKFYFSEAERKHLIRTNPTVRYYEIIPYIGHGEPNYLDIENKIYKETLSVDDNGNRWKYKLELQKQLEAA